ncbi:hypothetical protein SYNTR_0349 [Candidatus Syntrophocurvum alkaliphilum]|uniref:Uncharacterized protein n=1 Tax=Candidatus Syntrophocurvum alkaliphilum TaxID=2293317 RepID=A0A6I6DDR2_9FIRM|nr:hypothetical protein [Candidatus Syntrophocurvum alkaliphilum]QGT98942.1 hypothetical protein SYNTR_0349 [Candidatus Syntrophocurvum alkaliphilum]
MRALSLRERIFLFILFWLCIIYLFYNVFYLPTQEKILTASQENNQLANYVELVDDKKVSSEHLETMLSVVQEQHYKQQILIPNDPLLSDVINLIEEIAQKKNINLISIVYRDNDYIDSDELIKNVSYILSAVGNDLELLDFLNAIERKERLIVIEKTELLWDEEETARLNIHLTMFYDNNEY